MNSTAVKHTSPRIYETAFPVSQTAPDIFLSVNGLMSAEEMFIINIITNSLITGIAASAIIMHITAVPKAFLTIAQEYVNAPIVSDRSGPTTGTAEPTTYFAALDESPAKTENTSPILHLRTVLIAFPNTLTSILELTPEKIESIHKEKISGIKNTDVKTLSNSIPIKITGFIHAAVFAAPQLWRRPVPSFDSVRLAQSSGSAAG